MSRLLEFRGKRLDNKEWVFGAYIPDYTLENPTDFVWIADNEYGINYPVDPKTIGQAFMINEVKYFEGDLLRWRGNTLRVVFDNGMLLAVHENGDFQSMGTWDGLDKSFVVGNIHDAGDEIL